MLCGVLKVVPSISGEFCRFDGPFCSQRRAMNADIKLVSDVEAEGRSGRGVIFNWMILVFEQKAFACVTAAFSFRCDGV